MIGECLVGGEWRVYGDEVNALVVERAQEGEVVRDRESAVTNVELGHDRHPALSCGHSMSAHEFASIVYVGNCSERTVNEPILLPYAGASLVMGDDQRYAGSGITWRGALRSASVAGRISAGETSARPMVSPLSSTISKV